MLSSLKWRLAQAAEWRWWKHYLKKKGKAEYLYQKKQYWYRIFQEVAPVIPYRASILDAGCGPAGIFMIFDQCEVDAIDPLIEVYERELPHFSAADYTYVNFISSPLEEARLVKPYDWVFCLNVINHVRDIERAIQQLAKAAGPQKKVVLSVDAHNYDALKFIFQWLPGDILHPHQYSLEDYIGMLSSNGLEIEQVKKLKSGLIFSYYLLRCTKA
jgi:2-polyprenyl-3-methyl-5-hydroxy-6-metoxy-1,4-benzoquinol methylase